MRSLFIFIIVTLLSTTNACNELTLQQPTSQSVISQYGITVNLKQDHTVGQWANGDYWVVGPLEIDTIDPPFTGTRHGSTINIDTNNGQGYDSRISSWQPARAVIPASIPAPATFIKAVSGDLGNGNCRPCLDVAIIITVVDSVPPGNGHRLFRPPYFGSTTAPHWSAPYVSIDDVDTSVLPRLTDPPQAIGLVTLGSVFDRYQKLQLDHLNGWVGRNMHPVQNLPDYGGDIGVITAYASARLMFSDIDAQSCALVTYLQAGLDHGSYVIGGGSYVANGGHMLGRKLLMVMASLMLNLVPLRNAIKAKTPSDTFHEDGSLQVGNDGTGLWGSFPYVSESTYWTTVRDPSSGSKTQMDPYGYVDGGAAPGTSYQVCCNSRSFMTYAAILEMIPEAKEVWNNPTFSNYSLRWGFEGIHSQPDPCAPMPGTCAMGGAACSTAKPCASGSCNLDNAQYGVAYGPDGNGGCILDTDVSDGIGRWPQRHGTAVASGGYNSNYATSFFHVYAQRPPPQNAPMCTHLTFDGNTLDSGSLGNDLTLMGGAQLSAVGTGYGDVAQALQLDGTTNKCGSLGNQAFSGYEVSVMAWIKPMSAAQGDARIVSKASGSNQNDHVVMLSLTNGGDTLRSRVKSDVVQTVVGRQGSVPTNGEWVHVALTFNGHVTALYVNGVIDATSVKKDRKLLDMAAENVFVGCNPPDGSAAFNGLIDEVRVCNYAYSYDQIKAFAQNTQTTPQHTTQQQQQTTQQQTTQQQTTTEPQNTQNTQTQQQTQQQSTQQQTQHQSTQQNTLPHTSHQTTQPQTQPKTETPKTGAPKTEAPKTEAQQTTNNGDNQNTEALIVESDSGILIAVVVGAVCCVLLVIAVVVIVVLMSRQRDSHINGTHVAMATTSAPHHSRHTSRRTSHGTALSTSRRSRNFSNNNVSLYAGTTHLQRPLPTPY